MRSCDRSKSNVTFSLHSHSFHFDIHRFVLSLSLYHCHRITTSSLFTILGSNTHYSFTRTRDMRGIRIKKHKLLLKRAYIMCNDTCHKSKILIVLWLLSQPAGYSEQLMKSFIWDGNERARGSERARGGTREWQTRHRQRGKQEVKCAEDSIKYFDDAICKWNKMAQWVVQLVKRHWNIVVYDKIKLSKNRRSVWVGRCLFLAD